MTKTLPMELNVKLSENEVTKLVQDLQNDAEIEEVKITESLGLGIGEAIGISVVASLIVEFLKKTPSAINKMVQLIQRLLNRTIKTKDKTPTLTITYEKLVLEFNPTNSEEEILRQLKKIFRLMGS